MKLLYKYLIAIILISPGVLQACELTDEYKEARYKVTKDSRAAYEECRDSVSRAKYWYQFVQCVEADDGKNIGGGCGHIANLGSLNYKTLKIDGIFCLKLRPTSNQVKMWLKEIVSEENIKKCK